MQDLHAKMLGAVLGGEGLHGVAELAAVEAGGPVAIRLPGRGLDVLWPAEGVGGAETQVEVPILAGD